MRHLATLLLLFSLLASAAPVTEKGELNGASFRIDMPENWNGTLLVYCHGYSMAPIVYEGLPPDSRIEQQTAAFVEAGYAVIQSAYSATGWAVEEAVIDTEALRRLFIRTHGQPKETYVLGHSMGGFLTMLIAFPTPTKAGWRCAVRWARQAGSSNAASSICVWCSITISLAFFLP
jgi:pimeloyl-ACP methyl ester carboxylesterase